MRNTLEDLYYGNITPGVQQMAPNSELKRATDRVTRFESQLTERLDEAGQEILAKLIESKDEIESITALENFILGFRLGARLMAECSALNVHGEIAPAAAVASIGGAAQLRAGRRGHDGLVAMSRGRGQHSAAV